MAESKKHGYAALLAPEAPNRHGDWVGGRAINIERLFDEIYAVSVRVTELEMRCGYADAYHKPDVLKQAIRNLEAAIETFKKVLEEMCEERL